MFDVSLPARERDHLVRGRRFTTMSSRPARAKKPARSSRHRAWRCAGVV